MTSESSNNESFLYVKTQMEKMFETMHNFETGDKMEALGYLKKCLDLNNQMIRNEPTCSNETKEITNITTETTNKIKTNKNHKKFKFKTTSERTVIKRNLKCRICGVPNKKKSSLIKHLESHVGTPISCKKCKRDFNNRSSFLCHISLKMCRKQRVTTKKYYCDQCPKVFNFKRHYEKHTEGHKRNNCTYCELRLTTRKQLVEHLLSVHSIKLEKPVMYKCDHCEKRYVKKRSLYHHFKQHAENKEVCMECGHLSSTAGEHEKHVKEHDKDKPWQCSKCNDRFSRRQQYLIHVKRHDRYKCVTCDETFASKARVIRHKQRGHTVQGLEPQLKCSHCPRAFQRRFSLQLHMKKHLDDKAMHCKYCDNKFRSPYLYFKHCNSVLHEINSPEKRQLVCEICGKLFGKKYQLELHLHRVHCETKPILVCEHCSYKTTIKKNMERHVSLHLENKKEVMCEQCGKVFFNLLTLKDHISYVHLQARDYKCDQCDKAFKRNSELVRHKTSHSLLRPHVCESCGQAYKRSSHLRRHEKTQHDVLKKNRRVQRLVKDENGILVPVPDEKNPKATEKKQPDQLPVMDVQLADVITLTLPEINSITQDIIQTVELPNLVLNAADNIILSTTDQTLNLINPLDSNLLLNNDQYFGSNINDNMLQQNVPIQNSTTCDILLSENRILNIQSQQNDEDFPPNPYQFL